MRKIIEMLYDGKIDPEEAVDLNDSAYQAIIKKQEDAEKYLKQKLSAEDIERLDEYSDLEFERSSMCAYANFRYALKLGVLLMCEIFMDNDILQE